MARAASSSSSRSGTPLASARNFLIAIVALSCLIQSFAVVNAQDDGEQKWSAAVKKIIYVEGPRSSLASDQAKICPSRLRLINRSSPAHLVKRLIILFVVHQNMKEPRKTRQKWVRRATGVAGGLEWERGPANRRATKVCD